MLIIKNVLKPEQKKQVNIIRTRVKMKDTFRLILAYLVAVREPLEYEAIESTLASAR